MRWGVRHDRENDNRKESYSVKTKSGETLTLERYNTPLLTKGLSKISPKIRQEINNTRHYAVKNSQGKTVGDYQLYRKSPDEMNITWGSIDKKHQADKQGYVRLGKIKTREAVEMWCGLKKKKKELR